ncbi:MAG: hypothetical protein ACRCVT_01555 [Leadbetterella sp.]
MINLKLLLASMLIGINVFAQTQLDFPIKPSESSVWHLKESKWETTDKVDFHPFESKKLKVASNGSILLGRNGAGSLRSSLSGSSYRVRLSFSLDLFGSLTIELGGNHSFRFNSQENGVFYGANNVLKPQQNVLRKTGLWQSFDAIVIEKEKFFQVQYVKLNGVKIYDNLLIVKEKNLKATTLNLTNDAGNVAVKDIEFNAYTLDPKIELNELSYKIKEAVEWHSTQPSEINPIEGKTNELLLDYPNNTYKNCIIYTSGKMKVKKTDTYLFKTNGSGRVGLTIDNKVYFETKDFAHGPQGECLVNLSEGEHSFILLYQRPGWWTGALSWTVESTSSPIQELNSKSMVQEIYLPGEMRVTPINSNENIRSFINFRNKKLTHVISSGSPMGYHFCYDLNQATPLYFWKGKFADVTEMWYDRGEPQLLMPQGLMLENHGKFPIKGDDKNNPIYKGYSLDASQVPTFSYRYGALELTNKISPLADGFQYEVNESSGAEFTILVAEVPSITYISKRMINVSDRIYVFPENTEIFTTQDNATTSIWAKVKNKFSYTVHF